MTRPAIVIVLPLLVAACAPRATVPAAAFVEPGVRQAQEQACAAAVAARSNVSAGAVQVRRTSSDPQNRSIVNFVAGGANGYCRVTVDAQVVEVVL
jgi:hypothetical protein